MKTVFSIIGLISTIDGSSRMLKGLGSFLPTDPSNSCLSTTCLYPSGCIEGIGCVDLCGTIAGLQCSNPLTQTCIYPDCDTTTTSDCGGYCVETCGGNDQCSDYTDTCIDSPFDNCDPDNGDAYCDGFCLAGSAATTEECGENEELKACGSACPRSCDSPFQICLAVCQPNVCRCKTGYILDSPNGVCIPEDECPTDEPVSTIDPTICLGANQNYTRCGSACPASCTPTFGFIACPAICIPGCFCNDGYVLDDDGECVLPEDCPTTAAPTCEGENEEYTTCGSYCPGTCDNRFDLIACPLVCVEGCFCKSGYVYDDDGNCVLEEDCPVDVSTTMTPTTCDPGCDADEGYVCADDDGSGSPGCVLIGDECDGCNRYFGSNSYTMPCYECPDGVNYYGACDGCTWQETFFGGVKCLDTRSQCPEVTEEPVSTEACDVNEYYSYCGTACPRKCGDYYFNSGFSYCSQECVEGCVCKPGYVLDQEDGECIPYYECPTEEPMTTADPITCGDNEEYTRCGSACPATCTPTFGFIACPAVCIPGCFCKDGYVLNDDGECVLEEECPTTQAPTCDDDNAEYTTCGSYCPKNCDNLSYFDKIACITLCVEGCFCKDGYVYDSNGMCVLEEDCPMADTTTVAPSGCHPGCNSDEGYACVDGSCVLIGSECDDCYRLYGTNSYTMPCNKCPDGVNYYGSCDGCTYQETFFGIVKCLDTISYCPIDESTEEPASTEPIECGDNEELQRCGTACPRKCGDDDFIACIALCERNVCRCKDGYILDEEDGECIPEDECPTEEPETTIVCGENEELKACGTPCPKKCGDSGLIACAAVCQLNVCRCKDGYVLDAEDGECIPEDECPSGSTDEPASTEQCADGQTRVEEYGCIDICLTIQGLQCDDGDICVDDPRDNCDPDDGGSDCAGYCIPEEETTFEPNPSDANAYGLLMIFGVVAGLFAWM